MKNLKKVLSLALALVMAMSLMTTAFAADASDFADYDKVTNTEAMDVMVAVGVFEGADGKLDPTGTLTREQAAKIVTYMLMGKDQADKLTAATAPYADVAADRWSAGSIAYCTSEGILAGSNGKFNPTDKLTGQQFAKMLLCALGYNAEQEGLVGGSWAIKASTLATKLGLDKNVDVLLSANLTREQAAQMALNALKTTCVEYVGGTNITIGDTIITQGATRVPVIDNGAFAGKINNTETATVGGNTYTTVQLGEKLYKGDLVKVGVAANDSMGRPAYGWTYKGARTAENPNGQIGKYTSAPEYTIVINGDTAAIYAKNQNVVDLIKKETGASFLKNVADGVNMMSVNGANAAAVNNYVAGIGDVIEVYVDADDADTITKVVVADYTYDTIALVNTNVNDTQKKAGITHVITTAGGKTIDNTTPGFNADTFVKDAKIAVALKPVAGTVQDAYVLTQVSGAMSAYTGTFYTANATNANTFTSITVGGTKYTAQADLKGTASTESFKATDSYDLYLDANGYVLFCEATGIKTDLANVRYITAQYVEATTVYGVEGYNIYAQTVDLEGTVDRVLVATASYVGTGTGNPGRLVGDTDTTTTYYPINGNAVGTGVVNAAANTFANAKYYSIKGATDNLGGKTDKLVYFTDVTDESYKTANLYNDSNVNTYNGTTELKTSTTKLANNNYVTADTKFVLVNGTMGSIKVKVYTGPVALPAAQQTSGEVIYTKDANGNKIADYVVIKTTSNALTDDTTTRTVYYLADTSTAKTTVGIDGKTTVTSYTMYDVNGNAVEVAAVAKDGSSIANNKFYTVYSLNSTTGVATLEDLAELGETAFSSTDTTKQKTALYDVTYVGARYGDKISGTNGGGASNFVASDINAANTVVIDLRSASDKDADCFGADITSLDVLQSAGLVAAAQTTPEHITFDAYATYADGFTVIFVKSIG